MPGYALKLVKKPRRCTILSTTPNVYSYCLWLYLNGDSSQVFASHCVQTLIICYRSAGGIQQSSCLVFNLSVQVSLIASPLDSRERGSTSKRSKNSRPIGHPSIPVVPLSIPHIFFRSSVSLRHQSRPFDSLSLVSKFLLISLLANTVRSNCVRKSLYDYLNLLA